ncbi:MAG: TatD family hydrolase [Muribaculaceae bacterium]|nr:TatD family hydrolase [Muribaculaceae bacterium]
MIIDAHTHTPSPQAILNISPGDPIPPDQPFSCGIHPWNASTATEATFAELTKALEHPMAIAIGECGLDYNTDIYHKVQSDIFMRQIKLSECMGKPMIIHCVKAWQELIRIRRLTDARMPWIYHGFRLKPDIARRLINSGIILSFGPKFNKLSAAEAYPDSMLIETDESSDISLTIDTVCESLGITQSELTEQVACNVKRIFY